jgi:hypothetical protein
LKLGGVLSLAVALRYANKQTNTWAQSALGVNHMHMVVRMSLCMMFFLVKQAISQGLIMQCNMAELAATAFTHHLCMQLANSWIAWCQC